MKGCASSPGSDANGRKILTKRRQLHQHVAQKNAARGGHRRRPAGCSCLQIREPLLRIGRPVRGLRRDLLDRGMQRRRIAALGGHAAQFQQRRQVVRLLGQDLLHELLELRFAVGRALPLDLQRQRILHARIVRIERGGLAEVVDRRGGVAAIALQQAQHIFDAVVFGSRGTAARSSRCFA